jgi:hypothetical protein
MNVESSWKPDRGCVVSSSRRRGQQRKDHTPRSAVHRASNPGSSDDRPLSTPLRRAPRFPTVQVYVSTADGGFWTLRAIERYSQLRRVCGSTLKLRASSPVGRLDDESVSVRHGRVGRVCVPTDILEDIAFQGQSGPRRQFLRFKRAVRNDDPPRPTPRPSASTWIELARGRTTDCESLFNGSKTTDNPLKPIPCTPMRICGTERSSLVS